MRILWFIVLSGLNVSSLAADLSGQVDWAQRSVLGVPGSGRINQVLVVVGQQVKKNQLLLTLDSRGVDAQLAAAQAQVKQTSALLAEAKRELQRAEELHAQTLIAIHELELVKLALAKAQAAVEQAKAQQRIAQLNREDTQLTAPFDGIVLARYVEPGQVITNHCTNTPLLELALTTPQVAQVWLSAEQWPIANSTKSWQVRLQDKDYPAQLEQLSLQPQADERYLLRVRFTPQQRIPAGVAVSVMMSEP